MGTTPLLQSLAITLRLLALHWLAQGSDVEVLDAERQQLTSIHVPCGRSV
jgi:hypothetical protein